MLPLNIEIVDQNGIQWRPAFRNLKFAKVWKGGDDLWCGFVLDRDTSQDYPDVGYGYDVVLRNGLEPIFRGVIRQIESDLETVTVKVLGLWVHLDDYGYGGMGKLWCESRYGKWKPVTNNMAATFHPERYQMDTQNRLFIAPRKNELFQNNDYFGALYYWCPYDTVVRVSFDYETVFPSAWEVEFYSNNGTPVAWGADTLEWESITMDSGVKDITLTAPSALIYFRLFYNAAPADYTGETGACRAVITNLRLWGETGTFSRAIESPSVIHVAEDIIRQIGV